MTTVSTNFNGQRTLFFEIPHTGRESKAIQNLTVKFSQYLHVQLNINADWGAHNFTEHRESYIVPSDWQAKTRKGTSYGARKSIRLNTVTRFSFSPGERSKKFDLISSRRFCIKPIATSQAAPNQSLPRKLIFN